MYEKNRFDSSLKIKVRLPISAYMSFQTIVKKFLASIFFLWANGVSSNPLLITDVTVISPERRSALPGMDVFLEKGKITRIEPHATAAHGLPQDTEVLVGRNLFLFPGLIDIHTHPTEMPGLPREMKDDPKYKEILRSYFHQLPRSYLYFGFTTVVDVNVIDPDRLGELRNAAEGPEILDCSGAVGFPDSYPMVLIKGEEKYALYPNYVVGKEEAKRLPPGQKAKDHTPQRSVLRAKTRGARCIKTHFERGFSPTLPWPTPEVSLLKQVVREAHANRLPVFFHANTLEAQKTGMEIGIDVFAHGLWSGFNQLSETKNLLDQIVSQQVAYSPTRRVLSTKCDLLDPQFFTRPEVIQTVPAPVLAFLKSEGKNNFMNVAFPKETEKGEQIIRANCGPEGIRARLDEVLKYLISKNAKFILGSDTVPDPSPTALPGANGYWEMKEWSELGLGLKEILKAATADAAQILNVDKRVGTVQVGKQANLVLSRKNPWETFDAYREIETVVVHGRPVARDSLSAGK
jgi:imidazolonepropionase-like amidohydrolase